MWEYMVDKMAIGDEFLTRDVDTAAGTDLASTAGFLSRLRGLGVLTVVSKKHQAYVWKLHEFKDVAIDTSSHGGGSSGRRTGTAHHRTTLADLGMEPAAPKRHRRTYAEMGVSTDREPPPSPPVSSGEILAATKTLIDSLHGLGKELLIFRREMLAATSSADLLAELARRERHRGSHQH